MPRLAGWEINRVPGFYHGAGAPGAATLEAGDYLIDDYYINDTANNLYRCSTAGSASLSVWTLVGGAGVGVSTTVWAQIATHDTTGAAESSFTWSSLTGDTDVSYVIVGRWLAPTPAAQDFLLLRPNADATIANYNNESLLGVNAATSANKNAGAFFTGMAMAQIQDNGGVAAFTAYLAAKTGTNRPLTATASVSSPATTSINQIESATWLNSATAITSLVVTTQNGNTQIDIGSHFELWSPRAVHVVSIP